MALLTQSVSGGATSSSVYNGDGLRTSYSYSGTTRNFVSDVASELPMVLQDGIYTYVYGLDLISATGGLGTHYLHYDGLGSTVNLTDSAGALFFSYWYDVFGAVRHQSGAGPVNFMQFTGEWRDWGSGMYYLRARHYDTGSGRFLSQDPVPMGNLYAYAANNPANFVDLDGLQPRPPCIPLPLLPCGNNKDPIAEFVKGLTRDIAPYALECAIWGGSAYITTGLNPGAAAAGCATGVIAKLVNEFISNPFVDCLVWGAGSFSVTRIAAKAALSSITAAKTSVAGCVSGAGSWFLNKEGLSMAGLQCANWAIPAAVAAKSWDRALAALGGCAGGVGSAIAD